MKKCPSFSEIIKNDKAVLFLTSLISFYIALIFCLPFRASLNTILITTIAVTFPLSIAYQKLKNFTLKKNAEQKPISFWYFVSINFRIFLIYFYAAYPGCIQFDELYQWEQIQIGKFNDWHPAVHTFIVALFSKIYNNFSFILVWQFIIFNFLHSSVCYEISKLEISNKIVKLAFFLTILSPMTCTFLTTLLKDVAFAIAILGLAEMFFLTYFSNGKWIQSNCKSIVFGITLALATMLRHNGILFSLPFFIVFAYFFYSKYIWKIFSVAVLIIAFVKGPVYSYFDVKPHPQAQAELCGLPMTILCESFVNNPSILDEETKQFMLSITDYKTWKEKYKSGSWNSVKYTSPVSESFCGISFNETLLNFSVKKICFKAMKTALKDPDNFLNAMRNLTKLVWKVSFFYTDLQKTSPITSRNISRYMIINRDLVKQDLDLYADFFTSDIARQTTHDSLLKGILQYIIIAVSIIFSIFWRPGAYMMILVLGAFFSFNRLRWKPFLMIFPVLVYNFGTMPLLCGFNDVRFFFYSVLIMPTYIIIMLADNKFIKN